mgnify:CR=1 FL=1
MASAPIQHKRLTFQNKLLLSYVMVVFIPTVLWSIFSYMQTNRSLLSQAQSSFNEIYTSAASSINNKFIALEGALTMVSSDASFVRTLSRDYASDYTKYSDVRFRLDPLLDALLLLHPEIAGIDLYVSNSLQDTRLSFHSLEEAEALPEFPRLSQTYETVWHHDNGTLYMSKRLLNSDDFSYSPIIRLRIPTAYFLKDSISTELKDYALSIQDDQGNDVLRQSQLSERADGQDHPTPGLMSRASPLSVPGWSITMQLDQSSALLPLPEALRLNLSLFVTIILLMLLVSGGFARSFSKRIQQLNAFLERAPSTRFREDIAARGNDEIDAIINSVGQMVRETRTLLQEVYEVRIQHREAEIKALQSQINPHFLYNTLSKINWISIRNGDMDTSYIVTALSKFYRSTLNHGNMVTTVREEMETTKAYIDIQLYVLEHSFTVDYQFDEDIMDYNLPSIILQPLVENAIEHGIRMRSAGCGGHLTLSGRKDGHDIVFEVADNGPGLTDKQLAEIFSKASKGYGVKNVNDRLRMFFDDSYGLRFHSIIGEGTCVSIRIPQYVDFGSQGEDGNK